MFKFKCLIVYTILIMISAFEKIEAKYDELFFDLSIKDIDGNIIEFNEYRNKIILISQIKIIKF